MHGYWDEARDAAAHEPDPRGLKRLEADAEYALGAVVLMIAVAGVLAVRILDRAESLMGRVKRRLGTSSHAASKVTE
jgi:hypothetical protein